MSEWVVLDISSMTKSTKTERILKILKDVSLDCYIAFNHLKSCYSGQDWRGEDNWYLPQRGEEQERHLDDSEEGPLRGRGQEPWLAR